MKRIGIDARLINQTGVGVYIRNLLRNLDTSDATIEYYIYAYPQDFIHIPQSSAFIKRSASYRWHSVDEQTRFLQLLRKDTLDLMHFTYFSFPYFYTRPFIITIHDLTPLLFKTGKATTLPSALFKIKHTGYTRLLKRGIAQSKAVLVPSESVKNDIVQLFGERFARKVFVTYEGVDTELSTMKADKSILNKIQHPYVLYVGNSYPHKNVESLLLAFSKISSQAQLVLVGPQDFFSKKITEYISELKISNRVTQLFAVTQEQKIALYKNALALVQPSLSEGFGLPLLEAQFFGCPVIASNIPVFDEILPKNILRFEPMNIDSISSALHKAVTGTLPVVKPDSNTFSFKKMAHETQQIYMQELS